MLIVRNRRLLSCFCEVLRLLRRLADRHLLEDFAEFCLTAEGLPFVTNVFGLHLTFLRTRMLTVVTGRHYGCVVVFRYLCFSLG